MHLPSKEIFPIEPVAIFAGNEKIAYNTGDSLQFWVRQHLSKELLFKIVILTLLGFKEVSWSLVYDTLHEVPRLFQLWVCKQVMNRAGKNVIQSR